MWKKTLPLLVLSGILLVGCTNKEAIPENNETPMEDVRDDAGQLENNLEEDVEGRDVDNGTINDNSQVEIIEDLNRKNDVE